MEREKEVRVKKKSEEIMEWDGKIKDEIKNGCKKGKK